MFQLSMIKNLTAFTMSARGYCILYRMAVSVKQYSPHFPTHKISAAAISYSVILKTRPKQFTKMLEESSSKDLSSKSGDMKLTSPVKKLNSDGCSMGADTMETSAKPVPLHDAVDPRELEWREYGSSTLKDLPFHYLMLAKFRLTSLVVLTSVGGYFMAPLSLDIGTLLALAVGTGLISSAANAVNQVLETPFDAQMSRTRNRPLVRGLLTPAHAVGFAAWSAISGTCILWFFTNASTTAFGLLNLLLYTSVYTPLKRVTIANTWVGSVVGAIPPLMGWSACTGGPLDTGAWLMAALLFAWQFPHFNALSWNLRQEYSRAGYRMMAVTNPGLCRRTALRYSVGMLALCLAAPVLDITTWTFAFDSFPLNAYLTYLAWRFYKESDSRSSRNLFRFTLVHLPALMLLMLISKKHYTPDASSDSEVNPVVASVGDGDSPAVISVMPVTKGIVS